MEKNTERHFPDRDPERTEKIRRIAYYLWLARTENNISGDAEQDYFQAERIFESNTRRQQLLVGSFYIWSVIYLAARSSEPRLESNARIDASLYGLVEGCDVTVEIGK
jgi:hypothetical protein